MSRLDALLGLYRLALAAPSEDRTGRLEAWLLARQQFLARLQADAPIPVERALERALLALVLSADQPTYDRLVHKRRELAALIRRPRGYGL